MKKSISLSQLIHKQNHYNHTHLSWLNKHVSPGTKKKKSNADPMIYTEHTNRSNSSFDTGRKTGKTAYKLFIDQNLSTTNLEQLENSSKHLAKRSKKNKTLVLKKKINRIINILLKVVAKSNKTIKHIPHKH